MGWLDSPEDKKIKETKKLISEKGLLNLIEEKDYQKVSILQRECMIALLTQLVIANSGMVGDAIALSTQGVYYKFLGEVIEKK